MFYFYQLPITEPPLAAVFSQALSATSTDVAALTEILGLRHQSVGAASTETAGHISLAGRGFSRAQTSAAALVKSTFHLNQRALSAATAEAAAVVRKHLGRLALSAVAAEVVKLLVGKPLHTVLATADAQLPQAQLSTNKPFAVAAAAIVSRVLGSNRGPYNAASAEASGLTRNPGLVRTVAATEAPAMVRSPGRRLGTTLVAVVARVLVPGKKLSLAGPASTHIVRAFPFHLSAASPESVSATPGLKVFFRLLVAANAQALAVLRGMVAVRGAASAESTALTRVPGKVLRVGSAEVAGLARRASRLINAILTSVAVLTRQFGTQKQVAQAQFVTASGGGLRHVAVATSGGSIAHIFTAIFRSVILHAATANAAVLALHATVGHVVALAVAQAQTIVAGRAIGRLLVATGSTAAALRLLTGRAIAGVASTSFVIALKTLGKALRTASPDSAATFLARFVSQIRGITQAQVLLARASYGRVCRIGTVGAVGVVRATSHLISLLQPQHPVSGKGNFRRYNVTAGYVASVFTPHGKILSAVNVQIAAVMPWYHLFVPAWLQQQTTFLPPGGGPAEPPAFSTIDPSDQTTFAFDWSGRIGGSDPIVSSAVVSVPPGLTFYGPVFVQGTLVQCTVMPFSPLQLPTQYKLRCTVVTRSGRRSSFSIPLPVRNL